MCVEWNHLYLNNRYYLRLNLSISLSMISDLRILLAQRGARGQNQEHLYFFFLFVFHL